jgi:hypothetical protein
MKEEWKEEGGRMKDEGQIKMANPPSVMPRHEKVS